MCSHILVYTSTNLRQQEYIGEWPPQCSCVPESLSQGKAVGAVSADFNQIVVLIKLDLLCGPIFQDNHESLKDLNMNS